jgi:hypothetical protein
MTLFFLLATLGVILYSAFTKVSLMKAGILLAVLTAIKIIMSGFGLLGFIMVVLTAGVLVLGQVPLRKKFLSKSIFLWFRSV